MSTGRPVSALRVAATPVSTESAPARAPARWFIGSSASGTKRLRCNSGSPPKCPPGPCSTQIRSTERSVPSTRISSRPCGASKACFSYMRTSIRPSVPLKAR